MSNFRHADDAETLVRSFAVTFRAGSRARPNHLAPPHSSDWHQLIHAIRGVVCVTAQRHTWIVPPHRAVWIPGGVESSLTMKGEVALRMLYVRRGPRGLPRECAVVNVPPLLRELIIRVNGMGALDGRKPEQSRLAGVVVDELKRLQTIPLQLPLPADQRAARFAALAGERLSVSAPLDTLTRKCGASRRTLERIFQQETSLSLGRWLRRQLVLNGLARLGSGQSVQSVAEELGYSSASAFIAMFRKEMGKTPARYLEPPEAMRH